MANAVVCCAVNAMSETPVYAPSLPPPTTTPYQRRHERTAASPYPITNHTTSTPDAKTAAAAGGWLGSVRTFIGDTLSKLTANVARADAASADTTTNAPPTPAALSPLTLPPYSFDNTRARIQVSPLNGRTALFDTAPVPMNGIDSTSDDAANAVPYRKRARAPSMSLSTPIRPAPSPPPTTFRAFDSAQMLSASPAPHHRQHIATVAVTYTPLQPPSQSSSSTSAQRILSSISRQSMPIIDTKRSVRTPLISPQPIIMAETSSLVSSGRKSRPSLRGRFDPTRKLFTPIKARMAETEMKLNSEMAEERKYEKQQTPAADNDTQHDRQERSRDRAARKPTSTPSRSDSFASKTRDDESNHIGNTKRARRQTSDDDTKAEKEAMEDERPTTITLTKPDQTHEQQNSKPSNSKASTTSPAPIPTPTFSALPASPKPSTLPTTSSSTSLSSSKPGNPFLTLSSDTTSNTASKLQPSSVSAASTNSHKNSATVSDNDDGSDGDEIQMSGKTNARSGAVQTSQSTPFSLFPVLTSSSSSSTSSKPLLSFPSFDTTPALASAPSRPLLPQSNPTNIIVTAPSTTASTSSSSSSLISSSSTAPISAAKVSAPAPVSGDCKYCLMPLDDVDHSGCADEEEANAPTQLSGAPSFSLNIPNSSGASTAAPLFSFNSVNSAPTSAAPLTFNFPTKFFCADVFISVSIVFLSGDIVFIVIFVVVFVIDSIIIVILIIIIIIVVFLRGFTLFLNHRCIFSSTQYW